MQGPEASNLYSLLLQKLGTEYSADKIKGNSFDECSFDCLIIKKNIYMNSVSYSIGCSPFTDGKFGAMMQVHIQNDGPVTIEIESPKKE